MKKFAIVLVMMFSCTDSDRVEQVLEDQGYTNVETTGYAWNRCSESDGTCTGFRATSPSGRGVSGAVGCGRTACSKGCTIRFD